MSGPVMWQGLPVVRFSSARCEVTLSGEAGEVTRPLTKYEALCFLAHHGDLNTDLKSYGAADVNASGGQA